MLHSGLDKLSALNEFICKVTRNLAGLTLIMMVFIVMLQIVCRYILNDSPAWTEEVARTMMVWTAFLVAPWAYREGLNVRIGFFADELPSRQRKFLNLVINFLICWILLVFLVESFGFWSRGLIIQANSLPIKVAWFYAILPVALTLLLFVSVELIASTLLLTADPTSDGRSTVLKDSEDL